ncbi:MAG: DUF4339 domain-containing protein [Planctomycetota bacterium]|jgi:hypothetical protein
MWQVSVDGVQSGPFTESELRSKFVAGDVKRSDLASREGIDWTPIGDALRSAFATGDEAGAAFLDLCRRAHAVPHADVNACDEFRQGKAPSFAAARRALERQTTLLADARAGMQTTGDMGIAHAEGTMVLLPHLAPAQRLTKLLHADAEDHTLISSLVAMAIARTVAAAGNSVGISAETRVPLHAAAAWLTSDDPFGIVSAVAHERDYNLDYMAGEIRGGRLHQFAQIEDLDRSAEEKLHRAARDLDTQVARCKEAYTELIRLCATGGVGSTPELQAFMTDVEHGLYGDVAAIMVVRAERFFDTLTHTMNTAEISTFTERVSDG